MTHSPLEVSPIRAGAKLEGGQIFQWSAFGDVGIATTWCSYNYFIKGILSLEHSNIIFVPFFSPTCSCFWFFLIIRIFYGLLVATKIKYKIIIITGSISTQNIDF